MMQKTNWLRTSRWVCAGAFAIACFYPHNDAAAETSALTVFESISGHSKPATPITQAPADGTGTDHRVVPLGRHPLGPAPAAPDSKLQPSNTTTQIAPGGQGFNGIGVSSGYTVQYIPPDTSGAAGDTQYVQIVNAVYAVFDKATGKFCKNVSGQAVCDGANTNGYFFKLSGIFKAAGAAFPQTNPCANRDDGDPVVVFDRMAQRWILSQFAIPTGGPYYHCVAVSQTSDATGRYNVYAFQQSSFPDYPKMGVWPDGYYATFNMFKGGRFRGASVCVYERAQMLSGSPARQLCAAPNASYASLLSSDLDGKSADLGGTSCAGGAACPPAGTPNILANFYGGYLQLGFVTVNWSTGSGAISWPARVTGVASFTPACNGGACIPQPGTSQKLDSLGDRLMFRLAYSRPCLTYSSTPGVCQTWDNYHLVVSHAVTANPSTSSVTGIRWYDLLPGFTGTGSSTTLTTTINQQSTFSPNSDYRWMSSIAMDRHGNIAVGYSRASGLLYPSVGIALGAVSSMNTTTGSGLTPLTQESVIQQGGGSQTKYARWGDYTQMSVDPADGCTLWFTSQYQTATGVFNWSTKIYRTLVGSSCQ
jgi:hypothetical protein